MALIKCKECGKEFSDKAKVYPNCGYPLKREKAKEKGKKLLFQTTQKGLILLGVVCIGMVILFSGKLLVKRSELKKEQEIIAKYTGGNITNIVNKVWKTKHDNYYETYEFEDNYSCNYYKSGYTFEFNGETLPSFEVMESYYYKVEEREEGKLTITVFDIDFDTENISSIETLNYFPATTSDILYFNENMYGDDNDMFLPDDKPYYENLND